MWLFLVHNFLIGYCNAVIQVSPEKINLIIGSGGKKVKSIIEETGVEAIDTEDDGTVRLDLSLIFFFGFQPVIHQNRKPVK